MISSKTKCIILDTYGFIFRAFHVQPPLVSPAGNQVGAIYGLTSMLIKLLQEQNPSHLVAVFDTGSKTFRNEIYQEYKAHRPEVPQELISQFPYTRDVAKNFNILPLEKEGYEADDVIASLATQFSDNFDEIIIVSSDKDLYQLMNEKIKIYNPSSAKFISEQDVFEKFGVHPSKIRDVLALMGDKSDNIPGIPGIGPKTASQYINDFGDFNNFINNYHIIKSDKKRELISQNIENAKISYKLVELVRNINLNVIEQDIIWEKPKLENLLKFTDNLGFKSLEKRITKISKNYDEKEIINLNTQLSFNNINNNFEEITEISEQFIISKIYEESSDLGEITIYVHEEKVYFYLNNRFYFIKKSNHLIENFKFIMEDESIRKITYGIKNILKLFPNITSYEDIEIMNYILTAGNEKKSLNQIIKEEINIDELEVNSIKFFTILCQKLKNKLFNDKLLYLYNDIDIPLSKILSDMENFGVKFDVNILNALSEQFQIEITQLEEKIYSISNEKFNIASPKQLSEVLFNKLKLPSSKKNQKSQQLSTGVDVLEKLSQEGFEIADYLLKWRHLSKLKNTYTDSIPNLIDPNTKRVHTTYLQTSTTTGRLSSIDPNLQNIPIRTNEGAQIRKSIITEKNYKLVYADYSQIELRILSEIAGITSLKNAFRNKKDIHTHTASQIFNIDEIDVSYEQRRKAKAINFGIIYGISAFGLAKQLSIPRNVAKEYIEKYFLEYPGIKEYMENTINFARKNMYVLSLFGRRCYVPNINSTNINLKNFAERAAINAPIQSSSSDIVKIAMIEVKKILDKNLYDAKLTMQVHDELVFEVNENQVENFSRDLKSLMEKVVSFDISLEVDVKNSDNWF